MFLLMVVNTNALDTHSVSLEESGEEIANLSKYSGMESRELTEEEVLIVRRSLCDVGICICVLGIISLVFILYTMVKREKK